MTNDTGSSNDGITSNGQISIDGLEPGASWEYSIDNGENWSTGSSTLFIHSTGIYDSGTIRVRQLDTAGNISKETLNATSISVDSSAPIFNPTNSTPANDTIGVTVKPTIVMRFSEPLTVTPDLSRVYLKDKATDALIPAAVTLNDNGELVIIPSAALAYSTSYYVSWDADTLKDIAGNTIAAVSDETTFNFTTMRAPSSGIDTPIPPPQPETPIVPPRDDWANFPDNDGDGIPEQVENLVPSLSSVAGDGNGDGIADIQQAEVASVPFRNTQQVSQAPDAPVVFVTLVGGSENGAPRSESSVKISSAQQLDAPTDKPADLAMPLGLIDFTAVAASRGATETFSLFVDGDIAINGYWKQNTQGIWVNLASAEYGGRVVTENGKTRLDFTITDGGQFDDDGKADGIISDPGAPGWFGSADSDKDQFPDTLEAQNGLNVGIKDNDVFTSSKFFVMQLYRDILGREAEAAGLQHWLDQLDNGSLTQTRTAAIFLDSTEFQGGAGALVRLYAAAFERLPDQEGLQHWLQELQYGGSLNQVARSFTASSEFTTRYDALDSAGYIDQLYTQLLGRSAETAGKTYWKEQLENGQSRSDLLLSLSESQEYRQLMDQEVTLALTYLGLLDRSPDTAGYDFWLNQLEQNADEANVIASFMASTEYHDRFLPAATEVTLLGVSSVDTAAF